MSRTPQTTACPLTCENKLASSVNRELVTNAITASRAFATPGTEPSPVTLRVSVRKGELLIRVWDPDPVPPPRDQQPPGDRDENGRGLIIVAALSQRWGWHPDPRAGKHVWAVLPASGHHAPDARP